MSSRRILPADDDLIRANVYALPEFAELDKYRLSRDWTWEQLAAAMAKRDLRIAAQTLRYLVKRMPRGAAPRDRTLYKIRIFLKYTRALDATNRSAARRRGDATKHATV